MSISVMTQTCRNTANDVRKKNPEIEKNMMIATNHELRESFL